MSEIRVKYVAPPTVSAFLDSDDFVRCIMGPVGSGKSSGCNIEFLRRAKEQAPGPDGIRRSRWAAIRNTYPELRDTTRKTFEQWIPAALGRWREQEFIFELKFADIHSEILFRPLDRPEDVKKLLSLELTGAYVNELREIPKHVFEVLQTRVGRYPSKRDGGPTWFGVWSDTNPWHVTHWGSKLFKSKPEGHALFKQPGGRSEEAENAENLPLGYYERLAIGKDSEWIRVYVDGEEASSAIGSIYGELLERLSQRSGVSDFQHEADGIFTSWDLGISDSTAIWFWRLNAAGSIDVVDHYEAHGKGISHFFEIIDGKGFRYLKHWLPHDAAARTLVTGTSVQERFVERYGSAMVAITPNLALWDGISAARWLLEQPMRFHSRCADGMELLRSYRYEWDETAGTYSKRPLHDYASHTADAFRYMAIVARASELMTRKEKPAEKPQVRSLDKGFTLDELWDLNRRERRW